MVRSVCGTDFTVVDITTDPELERRYRSSIPVIEVDGVERFRYHVEQDDLRAVF